MNRSEVRNRILYFLNESTTNPVFFTQTDLNATIEEAQELLAEEVTVLREQAFIVTKPGRHWYTTYEVSPRCMTPFRIWTDGTDRRLSPVTMRQLEDHYVNFMSVNSDDPYWWYPISFDTFGLWPGPSEGGTRLRIDYLAWPRTLAQDSSTPVFNSALQDLIVKYGEYEGLIRQWEGMRAMDVFMEFIRHFTDNKYRTETTRFHKMLMARDGQGDSGGVA